MAKGFFFVLMAGVIGYWAGHYDGRKKAPPPIVEQSVSNEQAVTTVREYARDIDARFWQTKQLLDEQAAKCLPGHPAAGEMHRLRDAAGTPHGAIAFDGKRWFIIPEEQLSPEKVKWLDGHEAARVRHFMPGGLGYTR